MKLKTQLTRLESTIFYDLDMAIKSYRQFAQRNIKAHDIDITIDQWLVLKTIKDNPALTQKEIAARTFKDYASITRIIELLVRGNYLERSFHKEDRRRYNLELTKKGLRTYDRLVPVVQGNRETALRGISAKDIDAMRTILRKISSNCTSMEPLNN